MLGQLFRWLILLAALAAVLVAFFVAWWLAVLIALIALILGILRRLFGNKAPDHRNGGTVIIEGEYSEVHQDDKKRIDDDSSPR